MSPGTWRGVGPHRTIWGQGGDPLDAEPATDLKLKLPKQRCPTEVRGCGRSWGDGGTGVLVSLLSQDPSPGFKMPVGHCLLGSTGAGLGVLWLWQPQHGHPPHPTGETVGDDSHLGSPVLPISWEAEPPPPFFRRGKLRPQRKHDLPKVPGVPDWTLMANPNHPLLPRSCPKQKKALHGAASPLPGSLGDTPEHSSQGLPLEDTTRTAWLEARRPPFAWWRGGEGDPWSTWVKPSCCPQTCA